METTPSITTPVSVPVVVPLKADQQDLLDYFSKEWTQDKLSSRFVGGIRVFADSANPERVCLTAHCLREIMNAMEERKSGKRLVGLNEQLRRHLRKVAGTRRATRELLEGGTVALDSAETMDYIRLSEDFYRAFESEQQVWNSRVETLLKSIDPLFEHEDAGWREQMVKDWRDLKDTLNRLAHSTPATPAKFETILGRWVSFLLARVRPKTSENQLQIRDSIRAFEDTNA